MQAQAKTSKKVRRVTSIDVKCGSQTLIKHYNQMLQCSKMKDKQPGRFKSSKKFIGRSNKGKYKIYHESGLDSTLKIKSIW